ncbi:exodeoxyribonuclease V subunit alpha, partial [Halomonas sp.]|uniref:exodeoxyribonuclease V subunit alpha n=1 Tax=Halomonas sp. TaxID=1486246 RepID=UPI00356A284A
DDPPPLPSALLEALSPASWQAALYHPLLVGDGPGNTPLVLDGTRLYLRRYWHHERSIQQHIAVKLGGESSASSAGRPRFDDSTLPCDGTGTSGRPTLLGDGTGASGRPALPGNGTGASGRPALPGNGTGASGRPALPGDGAERRLDQAINIDALSQALAALFPATATLDWQKAACALAARSPFAVITGGPGTGKTTTVVKLLALLQTLALNEGSRALRIRLAAPTGKAAARLNESIAGQVSSLQLDGLATLWEAASAGECSVDTLRSAIPTQVTTLHRLLGSRPDTRHFRHHAHHPLQLDVLVVDEASMVDVEMMAALLDALPPRAHLVLLGDKDQLASVEAGSVLGDLCARADGGHYTPDTADWLDRATGQRLPADVIDPDGRPLDQAIAMLRVSHRFDAESGIGRLAAAVNGNDTGRQKR